jgi:hypothetical protein
MLNGTRKKKCVRYIVWMSKGFVGQNLQYPRGSEHNGGSIRKRFRRSQVEFHLRLLERC